MLLQVLTEEFTSYKVFEIKESNAVSETNQGIIISLMGVLQNLIFIISNYIYFNLMLILIPNK